MPLGLIAEMNRHKSEQNRRVRRQQHAAGMKKGR
jgi:hypothetical protein